MLSNNTLELAKMHNISVDKDENIINLLNDLRVLLELNITLSQADSSKTDPALYNFVKKQSEESKIKYKDMTTEEYFDFLYNECSAMEPEKAVAIRNYFSGVGETLKNLVDKDCAAVKGTVEDGVNDILTDAEKAITEDIVNTPTPISSDMLTSKITDALTDSESED